MPPAAHHRDGSTKEVGKVCFFCYFLRLKLGNDYLDIKLAYCVHVVPVC